MVRVVKPLNSLLRVAVVAIALGAGFALASNVYASNSGSGSSGSGSDHEDDFDDADDLPDASDSDDLSRLWQTTNSSDSGGEEFASNDDSSGSGSGDFWR